MKEARICFSGWPTLLEKRLLGLQGTKTLHPQTCLQGETLTTRHNHLGGFPGRSLALSLGG